MIKIDAIVNEDKMEDIKDALQKLKVNGMTISQVRDAEPRWDTVRRSVDTMLISMFCQR